MGTDQIDAELAELSGFDAYTLADGARRAGAGGGVIHALRPQTAISSFVGRALTARVVHEPNKSIPLKDYGAAKVLDAAGPADVLILDAGGLPLTVMGDLAIARLARRGARAAVVNALVRDVEEFDRDGLPVFALDAGITTVAGHGYVTGVGETLFLHGIRIANGDLIAGCRGGVVVAPWEDRASILAEAVRIRDSDRHVLEGIRRGEAVSSLWQKHKDLDS